MFNKVLVANRGEIAVRIIRGLQEMGIRSVAVYSDVDRAALHVRVADEAEHIGPAPSSESYLRIDRIIDAAVRHGVEAIHPGYGFLSENADFAEACERAGIVFIGPPASAIRAMGSKTSARRAAIAIGAPVVPGTEDPVSDPEEARHVARRIGYPVLLKAAAGGGGKGMRLVHSEDALEAALRDASSEAERAFSDSAVYIEKFVERPRHIEIQVLGDKHGHMIHLGERECSIQRRHQKVIEECPSPLIAAHPEMREAMGQAALNIARTVGYYNAGTMEFLVDSDRNFYFLEMNTRLQVEHPVTELVTGYDLVHLQLRIAAGERLTIRQEDVSWRGSAVECRIYAEDPNNNFLPSPGKMQHVERPSGPGIRLDTGIYPGWEVPMEYDPLLAKLAVWAETREDAIQRMRRALAEYYVSGIRTNISFFRQILDDAEFRAGHLHTGFIEEFFARASEPAEKLDAEYEAVAALAAAVFSMDQKKTGSTASAAPAVSRWVMDGRERMLR
jgi:acetyl-CoA carboxylase, biotin carboxylase subunit